MKTPEEILNEHYHAYITEMGMESINTKDFPVAYVKPALSAMEAYDNRDKWIPVTERPPEHSGHQDYTSEVVWVAYTSPSCGTMIYCGTGYADYDDDGVSWRVWDYLGRPDKYKEVKFWQPLPKAPQI